MKSNNELKAAAELLEYRVHRLNRFLTEASTTSEVVLRTEVRLIKDAWDQVADIVGNETTAE